MLTVVDPVKSFAPRFLALPNNRNKTEKSDSSFVDDLDRDSTLTTQFVHNCSDDKVSSGGLRMHLEEIDGGWKVA